MNMYRFWILTFLAYTTILANAEIHQQQQSARIIGGEQVDIAKHSYLVSIRYRTIANGSYWHECGGVIYTEYVVITAAQCVQKIHDNVRVVIVAGANTRTGADGIQYPVVKWIAHQNYSAWTVDNDIGLLMVGVPFNLGLFNVGRIQIANYRPAIGKIGIIAGWGYRKEYGPSSISLEETNVPIVSDADCLKAYGNGEISEHMICAGHLYAGGRDACQGDTGGPLIIDNELIGLVSWGRGCARPGYPGVYTYVTSLKQWIDDTIATNINL